MCGRFSLEDLPKSIKKKFALMALPDLVPRYNIAPGQNSVVILQERDNRPECQELYWGLVPFWAKGKEAATINARSETVDTKPSFREAFKSRRCLIPASGFYEWHTSGKAKTPFYFTNSSEEQPVVFAGLWEDWHYQGEHLRSFTILTTEANDLMRPIHDRLPVILRPADWDRWLDLQIQTREKLNDLFRPVENNYLQCREVGPYVNNVHHEGKDCITQVTGLF